VLAVTAQGPSAWWYATRGAGAMTTVLLTAGVVLGIAEVRRWQPLAAPRFGIAALHRTVSLLALSLLVVHVGTTLADPFPRIGLRNAVLPFATGYRPLWIGLGTIASDLLIAVAVTSLVRRRLGFRSWRAMHWLSYGCWPIALLHGLGAGSDAQATWMLALTAGCVLAVLATVTARLVTAGLPGRARAGSLAAVGLAMLGLGGFALQGPLATGWARRAGTPDSVLAAFRAPVAVRPPTPTPRPPDRLAQGFVAAVAGRIKSGAAKDGTAVLELPLRLSGGVAGRLRIRLAGTALPSGGLQMDRSAVTLGSRSRPGRYQGRVRTLHGQDLEALVGSTAGRALRLRIHLSSSGASVRGSVRATPITSTG
jgi:methionine sulfoxide reductase heme-binding subunit